MSLAEVARQNVRSDAGLAPHLGPPVAVNVAAGQGSDLAARSASGDRRKRVGEDGVLFAAVFLYLAWLFVAASIAWVSEAVLARQRTGLAHIAGSARRP
jgi:hypothetical protein